MEGGAVQAGTLPPPEAGARGVSPPLQALLMGGGNFPPLMGGGGFPPLQGLIGGGPPPLQGVIGGGGVSETAGNVLLTRHGVGRVCLSRGVGVACMRCGLGGVWRQRLRRQRVGGAAKDKMGGVCLMGGTARAQGAVRGGGGAVIER